MRHYLTVDTKYYCGVDLHKERMYACIMDKQGRVYLHRNMQTNFETFLLHIEPFLPDLIVGAESMFCYYWLFDKCNEAGIPFYLGHAYYMKAVHGGKTKNDRLDSQQIANLMRTNYFPLAYPYPKEMRGTRDLLRRRHRYVFQRGEAYRHIKNVFAQQGITNITLSQLKNQENCRELIYRFNEPDLQHMIEADFDFIEFSTKIVLKLERQIRSQAKIHDHKAFDLLLTIPGVGEILALTILYEIHKLQRFTSVQQFSSYCRLVKCERESDGKKSKGGNPKIGNPYLKYAFTQIIITAQRTSPVINKYYQRLISKFGKSRARTIIAHKFAVAVYFMLKNGQVFDENLFVQTNMK